MLRSPPPTRPAARERGRAARVRRFVPRRSRGADGAARARLRPLRLPNRPRRARDPQVPAPPADGLRPARTARGHPADGLGEPGALPAEPNRRPPSPGAPPRDHRSPWSARSPRPPSRRSTRARSHRCCDRPPGDDAHPTAPTRPASPRTTASRGENRLPPRMPRSRSTAPSPARSAVVDPRRSRSPTPHRVAAPPPPHAPGQRGRSLRATGRSPPDPALRTGGRSAPPRPRALSPRSDRLEHPARTTLR